MSDWPSTTVGAVSLTVTKGTTPTTLGARFQESGIRFVKVESLTSGGRIDDSKVAFIDAATHALLKRSILEPDDLLFSIAGTIGRVARVRPSDIPANTNQAVAIVRPDQTVVDSDFLYYCLRDKRRIARAQTRVVQSVQQNLSLTELSGVEIPLPPVEEQRGIAATLGALDDKIESSRRTIRLTPELVRARVRSALQHEANSVAVANIARFVNGGAYTKDATGTGRMVIRIADLNSGPGPSTVYNDIDVPDDKTARPGDILMSWSGSLGVYRWFREEAIVNQHIFKVLPAGYPDWLVFDRLEHVLDIFQGIAKDKATTMGHIQRGHLESTSVAVPTPTAIDVLSSELGPLWNRLLVAEQECLRLERLRDVLLPELLSGRTRVPGASGAVA